MQADVDVSLQRDLFATGRPVAVIALRIIRYGRSRELVALHGLFGTLSQLQSQTILHF